MRKFVLSFAAAGAALIAASPAAAQYYQQPYYGGQPYGGGYGYGYGNFGEARALHARIDRIEWQIRRLDGYRAGHLEREAQRLERRLDEHARNGLNPYEAQDISYRIQRLEQQVRYAASYGYGDRDDRWGRDRDDDRD